MEYFDSGLFLILATLAFVFMVLSFRYLDAGASAVFFLFSTIVFMVLALVLVSETPIQSITIYNDGNTTWTQTDELIGTENGYILGMFFLVFGILNAGLLVWKMMPAKERFD